MYYDRERLYDVYHTVLSIGLTLALTISINQYFVLKLPMVLCAVFSIILTISIYLSDLYRKNAITYVVILSIFPILALVFWFNKLNPSVWLRDLMDWISKYDGSSEIYVISHAYTTIIAITLLAALIFYLLMKKLYTKIALALLLIIMLIVISINKIEVNKAVIGICIFYILSILVEVSGFIYSKKSGIEDKKAGILYLAPLCLLLSLGSVVLPSKPEPLQWQYFKDMYRNVSDTLDKWFDNMELFLKNDNGDFSLSFTGFGDDIELGSSDGLEEDHNVALLVTGSKESKPIYLIGSVSDIYTGHSWEKSNDDDYISESDEYLLDYVELIQGLSRQNIEVLEHEQLIERRDLSVIFNNIRTKTLFYPIKTSWIKTDTIENKPNMEQASMRFSRLLGEGISYDLVLFEMNLQGDAFRQILREADGFTYDTEATLKQDTVKWLDNNILNIDNINTSRKIWNSYENLKVRAEGIRERYIQLPEKLPEKVRSLAIEITKDYDNNFDKLRAIERYLQKYPYTLQPGKLPKDEDFVSYFLFDNMKGYCTSFASAMAVLGRCIGIPTRYVEGFIINYDGENHNNLFDVKNSDAHAWAEAYFEGVGWIPFEATSDFNDLRYVEWPDKIVKEDNNPVDALPPVDEMTDEDYEEEIIDIIEGVIVQEEEEEELSNQILSVLIVFIASAIILILLLLIYYFILQLRYRKDFDKADNNKKMYMLFLRILRLLQVEGFAMEAQETLAIFTERINEYYKFGGLELLNVAEVYMHYRYGDISVTESELDMVNNYCTELENHHRMKNTRLRFLLEEFAFLSKKR